MELRQFEYFVQVAELGSFSKAADALSVSQPFVSKRIRQIESEMDAQFFRRHGRGIELTEEGEIFYSRARIVLDQVNGARVELESLRRSPSFASASRRSGKAGVPASLLTSSKSALTNR